MGMSLLRMTWKVAGVPSLKPEQSHVHDFSETSEPVGVSGRPVPSPHCWAVA